MIWFPDKGEKVDFQPEFRGFNLINSVAYQPAVVLKISKDNESKPKKALADIAFYSEPDNKPKYFKFFLFKN